MDKSTIKKLEKECGVQIKKNLELSEKNKNLTLQLDEVIAGCDGSENRKVKGIIYMKFVLGGVC